MVKFEIRCMENGPNLINVDGKVFAAMCRCGVSKSKPYCDGEHRKIQFTAESKIYSGFRTIVKTSTNFLFCYFIFLIFL